MSVDLDSFFPKLPEYNEKAKRLAQDPIAAADFYEFSVRCIFDHLFGWNFKTGKSSKDGGILGHVKAWYGINELTERGGLHGHFLIWLHGSLNPSDLHRRLTTDREFRDRVSNFFDNIVWHHIPKIENIELVMSSSTQDPRSERFIPPPSISPHMPEWLNDFDKDTGKYNSVPSISD
jgi:hypothetical protein